MIPDRFKYKLFGRFKGRKKNQPLNSESITEYVVDIDKEIDITKYNILDIGSGSGEISIHLSLSNYNNKIIACELFKDGNINLVKKIKENNIKNMLIKQITDSGKYDKETLKNYLNKIEVKTVPLNFEGQEKNGLVYRIPKELGGTNMFAAVDSPKIGMADLDDAIADSGPIVASIIGGTFGSTLGPMGTVVGSAVSAGFAEYARLWYGYHHLGLQNDIYPDPKKFNKVALNMSIKYAAIDAVATGVFLAGAKLILPTILLNFGSFKKNKDQ